LTFINPQDISNAMSAPDPLDCALNALADPTRRRILQALKVRGTIAKKIEKDSSGKSGCLCAGDIEERMRLSQPTISHHMAVLTNAGLVEATKQGQWRWYKRNEPAIRKLAKKLRTEI
jgi:ArsR family transcriptional regulator